MNESKSVRRICHFIIDDMLKYIPTTETKLIKALQWNREDSMYKAPEETLQWNRTMNTLIKYIPNPTEDWHFKVLSIFTTRSEEELRNEVLNN